MAKRPKPRLTTSAGEIGQLQHNEAAFAQRNLGVGGVYEIIGALGSRVRVGMFAALRIVNTTGTAAYVKIGDNTVTAPTGIADGHYVAPNGELLISTGEQGDYIIASAATVGCYKLKDSIVVASDDRQAQV